MLGVLCESGLGLMRGGRESLPSASNNGILRKSIGKTDVNDGTVLHACRCDHWMSLDGQRQGDKYGNYDS